MEKCFYGSIGLESRHIMQNYQKIVRDVLATAKTNNYIGYSKFDALNSSVLKKLSFSNKWLRLVYTQLVKEMPINIRPLLKVKKSRNPKGIALFARAYLFFYESTNNKEYLNEAESLIQWLLENPSPGQKHLCWGYNFIWQNTIFLQDEFEPNAVVTVFAGEALVHAYRITGNYEYLEAARSVVDFITQDLPVLHDDENERAIAYVLRKVDGVVLNNQVLTGAFLAKIWKHSDEDKLLQIAQRQMNYAVNRKTDYFAWYYTYPKNVSPIHHDNYHTGGILDGLLEYYEETGDDRYMEVYWKGLDYYRKNLFEPDGAPRWMNDRKYPFDIHGAAQGIITFKKAARHNQQYLGQAEKIAGWTIKNFYRKKTCDFAYRKGRFMDWNYSLMRWCNAWMARALAQTIK
jgi:rhamnogalacturonyl hydrolase YesR